MFNIDKNTGIIHLTAGDTAKIKLKINKTSGGNYNPLTTDTVTMVVKTAVGGTTKLTKVMNASDCCFYIQAADTDDWAAGDYIYDVRLETTVQSVSQSYTVVPPTKFVITPALQLPLTAPDIVI